LSYRNQTAGKLCASKLLLEDSKGRQNIPMVSCEFPIMVQKCSIFQYTISCTERVAWQIEFSTIDREEHQETVATPV
jgi:hypothetical protein